MGVIRNLPVARFFALSLHGVTIITLYFMKIESIQATLEPESRRYSRSDLHKDYRQALFRINLIIFFSWVYFVIEYTSLFSAYSLTWSRTCLFNICAHGLGAFFSMWSQLEIWSVRANEYLFLFCTLLPGTLEFIVFSIQARRHWLEIHAYADGVQKTGLTAPRLLFILFILVIGLLGLGLTIRYVHRSINTDRLLDAPAWIGICLLVTAFILALFQFNSFFHFFSFTNSIFQSQILNPISADTIPSSPSDKNALQNFRRANQLSPASESSSSPRENIQLGPPQQPTTAPHSPDLLSTSSSSTVQGARRRASPQQQERHLAQDANSSRRHVSFQ